jgi:hypothetical protein
VGVHAVVAQAVILIDGEIDTIKTELEYPQSFGQSRDLSVNPLLSLIPKYPNLGVMGMAEILTALYLHGGIEGGRGGKATKIALAGAFENAFGFSFNDIYDRQSELFNRKLCNLTKTLDALKTALTKEYQKRNGEVGKKEDKNKNEKR